MGNKALTISKLTGFIKETLENDIRLNNVYVVGEISNFKLHSSGHMYFSLKDETAKIKCVMFRGNAITIKFKPLDGMKVIVKGNISVYERDGQYQMYISSMLPDGVGDLYVAYEQLKKKLQEEGLFDDAYKKTIPMLSTRIGIATSPTGAVIRDIINVSLNRYHKVDLLLYPVKVQGDGAAESIIEAIKYFNTREDIDTIIIGRGGGSIEELWAFNDEKLARAIFKSKKPIISAVGHETDFTIADFVADKRASTPSQAAEIAVPSYNNLKFRIMANKDNLYNYTNLNLKNYNNLVINLKNIIDTKNPSNIVKQNYQYLDSLSNKISYVMKENFSNNLNRYLNNINKLDALSPFKVLKRGYAYIEKEDSFVNSINALKVEDEIKIHIHDGYANCKVLKVVEDELCQPKKTM